MADEFICSECGYTSPDLENLKNCPVCGGAIVGTYDDIDKFETTDDDKYPDELVNEEIDDAELLEGDLEDIDDIEEGAPRRKGRNKSHAKAGDDVDDLE